jgi:hypothetical protein
MADRIRWTQEEIDALAELWVDRRIKHPFEFPMKLMDACQQELLPQDRRRNLVSLASCKELSVAIAKFWRLRTDKVAPPEPVPPVIMNIEVPAPMEYGELLKNLDVPSIVALLVAKLNDPLVQVSAQLASLQAQLGVRQAEITKPPVVPLPLIAVSQQKKMPRVAVMGPLEGQFKEIERKATDEGLKVELRFVDNTKSAPTAPVSCDYCIITRHTSHDAWQIAQGQFKNDRLFIVHGGTTSVMQKLRDIASRQ